MSGHTLPAVYESFGEISGRKSSIDELIAEVSKYERCSILWICAEIVCRVQLWARPGARNRTNYDRYPSDAHLMIDTFILQNLIENEINTHGKELFFRIRLNWVHASHLMWRLRQEGIGKATIYPGYGGVVAALKEEHVHG